MSRKFEPTNFDQFAGNYENILKNQLAFFESDRDYFSSYKVNLIGEFSTFSLVTSVLDFGCGVGLSLPFLARAFPEATVYATDLSEGSLDKVVKNYPFARCLKNEGLDEYRFNLIFVSCVLHHVESCARVGLIKRLINLLSLNGLLFIFEHNPLNPLTRKIVSNCPFDDGVELLRYRETRLLIEQNESLDFLGGGHCLFFPYALKLFRPLEKWLRWLPLGGQYFVVGKKK